MIRFGGPFGALKKLSLALYGQYNLTKVINYFLFLISFLVVANLKNYSQFEHSLLIILFINEFAGAKVDGFSTFQS